MFIVFLYISYHSLITMFKLLLLMITTGVMLGLWSPTNLIERIHKRWISYGEHEAMGNVTHLYSTNSWYRYASLQAKRLNKTNCYICSLMPTSSSHPRLEARPLSKQATICVSWKSSPESWIYKAQFQYRNGTRSQDSCSDTHPLEEIQNATPLLSPYVTVDSIFPICFASNGTMKLGSLSKKQCNATVIPTTTVTSSSGHVTHWVPAVPCPWGDHALCWSWNGKYCPSVKGTPTLREVLWVCGSRLYSHLPPHWGGVCAPAQVTDHTYVVSAQPELSRKKRFAVKEHDSVWGTDVPGDQKIWTKGTKVTLSLFPWLGVGKLMLRMETLNYRLGLFVNATLVSMEGLNDEVSQIRLMVLQNRLVLDLLTASSGGVCVLLNDSCCTWIPDLVQSISVSEALQQMKAVRDAIASDKVVDVPWWNPFAWFTSGAWWQIVLKGLLPIVAIFILFCIFMMCISTCIKVLISSVVRKSVQNVMLAQEFDALLSHQENDSLV